MIRGDVRNPLVIRSVARARVDSPDVRHQPQAFQQGNHGAIPIDQEAAVDGRRAHSGVVSGTAGLAFA